MYNIDASRYDQMRPGCYDVDERVRDMNAGGQLAGLNFPNWTGFSGQVLNQGPDRATNLVMIKAYNDWHVDEWCGAHPGRFIPCGMLPLFDVQEAAKEVHRLAAKGCHAVTFSENPEALNMPSIHSGEWDPLFAACSETGTVLCCHLGSSSRAAMSSTDAPAGVAMSVSSAATIYTLIDLVWATFWERFPDLKFSLTEGDIGWIPYFLWRSEHVNDRHHGWINHDFSKTGGPTQIFRDHILCCFIKETVGPELLHHFNLDHVFWESDYPHSDGTWPYAPEELLKTLDGLDDATINKISHENAIAHLPVRPVRPPAQGAVHRRRPPRRVTRRRRRHPRRPGGRRARPRPLEADHLRPSLASRRSGRARSPSTAHMTRDILTQRVGGPRAT